MVWLYNQSLYKDKSYRPFDVDDITAEQWELGLTNYQKRENLDFYLGNTWKYWIGTAPKPDDANSEDFYLNLYKIFQKANKIGECVNRAKRALVGQRPTWYFQDRTGERVQTEGELKALNEMLGDWFDLQYKRSIQKHTKFINPIDKAVIDLMTTGEGYLRLFQPAKFANSPDPKQRIILHSPNPWEIDLDYDDDGLLDSITYRYSLSGKIFKEVQRIDYNTGLTLFRYEDEGGNLVAPREGTDAEFSLDLGGMYSIFVLGGNPLITDSVKRAQNALNYYLTLSIRNMESGGFLERILLNAQPPGDWAYNPQGDRVFTADTKFKMGAGKTNYIQGQPTYDAEGNITGYTTPQVVFREPIDPEGYIKAFRTTIALIYEEMGQGHILASDMQISGVSRQQLRSDFTTLLQEYKYPVESSISGMLQVAAYMMDSGGLIPRDSQLVAELNLSDAELSPEEVSALIAQYQANLLSQHTAMSKLGVKNPEDEIELIDQERESAMQAITENQELLQTTAPIQQENTSEVDNSATTEARASQTSSNPVQ